MWKLGLKTILTFAPESEDKEIGEQATDKADWEAKVTGILKPRSSTKRYMFVSLVVQSCVAGMLEACSHNS